MKHNTGKIYKAPLILSNGAYWAHGVLMIDGSDARDIVSRAIAKGTLKHSVEVFARDNVPISIFKNKPKRQ